MMTGTNQVNIVVFGCDNTGKTTLCENLERYYKETMHKSVNMVHSLGPNKSLEEQIDFMRYGVFNNTSDINIFDRFPVIEETVCGTILRNKNNFTNSVKGLLGYSYLRFVDLFVYCNPGLMKVLKWGEREQMEGVKENVVNLMNGYNKFAYELLQAGFNVYEYDYSKDHELDNIIKNISKISDFVGG